MRHRVLVAIASAIVTLVLTASPALAGQLPVIYNGLYGYAHGSPTASPPGANNWSCKQVDLVGHSQGGMMPRYYLKFLGGATNVHTLVGLAPSNRGTTLDGIFTLASYFPGSNILLADCPACQEQEAGSPFLTKLNTGGDTVRGVSYTVIESRNDEVVTPYTSAFLSGLNVTNITLQDQCPLDQGEHLSMPYDHIADADVLTALDPAHPQHPACTPVLPVSGG
jgi:triacylglycerol esterase/lipase EstA (alpha/beta hydrolase family)